MKIIYTSLLVLFSMSQTTFAQHTVSVTTPEGNTYTLSGDSTKLSFKATLANYEGRFEDAANYKIAAITSGETTNKANAYYDAACYFSLAKNSQEGFKYLKESLKAGFSDVANVMFDADLVFLREDKNWKKELKPYFKEYYASNNKEIAKMYGEDQAARMTGKPINWDELNALDEERRIAVLKLLKKGKVNSAHDYYKAAMILHHGMEPSDNKKAHELAVKALDFEKPHGIAPWLAAASKDRYLMRIGEPQWFGTQGVEFKNGKMMMNPDNIDLTAVTPDQRKAWNAPKLETLQSYLKNFEDVKAKDNK